MPVPIGLFDLEVSILDVYAHDPIVNIDVP